MPTVGRSSMVLALAAASAAVAGVSQGRDGSGLVGSRPARHLDAPVFVRPPADLGAVAAVIPLGNVNAVAGGHVRPVNHMYLEYLAPRDGGTASLDVTAMAAGRIVMVFQRQTEACVVPDHTVPSGCSAGLDATAMIDEYQVFIRHTGSLTSTVDHLHSLDAGLGLPDWHDDHAGWVRVGQMSILFLGSNGAVAPVRVRAGQRLGETRNYFTTWDIGVVDTRHVGTFLGSGLLRYPSLPEFLDALAGAGVDVDPMGPDQPFPGEMFVNAACFLDYMPQPLAAAWRAKLAGDGTCGRADWDLAGTLQGNWYRADVTSPTLENMFAVEENAISFSPYNYDPAHKTQIGFGANFLGSFATTDPPQMTALAAAEQRLSHGLLFDTDRTPATRHNPDPALVPTGGYACYDVPDPMGGPTPPPLHSVVVYLPVVDGSVHLRLRYFATTCTNRLTFYAANPAALDGTAWWGDYVR